MDFPLEDIEKILLSAVLGAIVGFEREWSGKSAGLRTMMLVSLGSALFTIVSYNMAVADVHRQSDVTRIASNIATGIGFIGAGLIFKSEQNIHGLTTAATVWAVAAIGMAVGIGNYIIAVSATVIIWFILVMLTWFERWFAKRWETRQYKIKFMLREQEEMIAYSDFFNDKDFKCLRSKTEKCDNEIMITWSIRASRENHESVTKAMLHNGRITTVDY